MVDDPRPTAFCSWTGGKDSCLACLRAIERYDVAALVHMAVRDDGDAGWDAVDAVLAAQARSFGVPLVRRRVTWDPDEATYRETLASMAPTHGVFGNVEGRELRGWVDDPSDDLDLTPVHPLWGEDPVAPFRAFLSRGFEAYVVKVDAERVAGRWLGEPLDGAFLDYLVEADLHPMGEFGEYHTLTVDGPLFEQRVPIRVTGSHRRAASLIAAVELAD